MTINRVVELGDKIAVGMKFDMCAECSRMFAVSSELRATMGNSIECNHDDTFYTRIVY